MIQKTSKRYEFIQGRENWESDMSVFPCIISEMKNGNKKGFKQNEKEKDKIRVLIVKDPWEGS